MVVKLTELPNRKAAAAMAGPTDSMPSSPATPASAAWNAERGTPWGEKRIQWPQSKTNKASASTRMCTNAPTKNIEKTRQWMDISIYCNMSKCLIPDTSLDPQPFEQFLVQKRVTNHVSNGLQTMAGHYEIQVWFNYYDFYILLTALWLIWLTDVRLWCLPVTRSNRQTRPSQGPKAWTQKGHTEAQGLSRDKSGGCWRVSYFLLACQCFFHLLIYLFNVYLFDFMCLFIWYLSILLIYFWDSCIHVRHFCPFPFSLFLQFKLHKGRKLLVLGWKSWRVDLAVETNRKKTWHFHGFLQNATPPPKRRQELSPEAREAKLKGATEKPSKSTAWRNRSWSTWEGGDENEDRDTGEGRNPVTTAIQHNTTMSPLYMVLSSSFSWLT